MAKVARPKPARLPEKLQAIRAKLNLSQSEMLNALGMTETSGALFRVTS